MTDLEVRRVEILRIAETYGASNVRVVATDDRDGPSGGLDLLVDMDPSRSLFDLVDLGRELTDLLGRQVEVLPAASLSPRLREQVQAAARAL